MKLLKRSLYKLNDKSLSFNEFDNYLNRISETATLLSTFKTRDEAINYLS